MKGRERIMKILKSKKENGITLIALIVTIIVLIILAVISMNAILGEDGIIKRAERSKAEHNEALAKEEVELAYSAILVDVYENEITREQIAEKLGEKLGITVTEDEDNYTMSYKGYDITISKTTGKASTETPTSGTTEVSGIKWIWQENAKGEIEILGLDLSEQQWNTETIFYLADIELNIETLNVPAQINGKKVTKVSYAETIIKDRTEDIFEHSIVGLKKIVYPEGIEEIEGTMFRFPEVTDVSLPSTLKVIGDYAFYKASFTSIEIPEGVTKIGKYSFADCIELTTITIPNGVESIGDNAFGISVKLESVYFPNSVKSIGNHAFLTYAPQTILYFNDGVNEELEISDNLWGATAVEPEDIVITFSLEPLELVTDSATYEAYLGETWAEWIERNKDTITTGIGSVFIGYAQNRIAENGDFNFYNAAVGGYSLSNEDGIVNKNDFICNKIYKLWGKG